MTDPETWLAARLAAGRPAETWKPVPGWPHEVSDQGRIRTAKGRVLTQRAHNRPREGPPERRYRKADLCRGADLLSGHQFTREGSPGRRGPPQSRHLDNSATGGRSLFAGTLDQNAADAARRQPATTPRRRRRKGRNGRSGGREAQLRGA